MRLKLISGMIAVVTVAVGGAVAGAAQSHPDLTPVGHSVIARLDNGLVARQDFAADGKSVTLTVLRPGSSGQRVGLVGTLPVYIAEIAPGRYQVSWIEKTGAVISNAQNLVSGTEQVFFSYRTADGVQHGEQHSGTIQLEPR
ncbi:MAG TPA: hypothetical protein VHF06_25820 [Pseudonocardiaceae bacterium]|jgi:hypothetical protein|nr:hypothetical protein [Pseudonocardiaceae bacterium]